MRKTSISLWATVALLALSAPCAPLAHAATHSANLELLTAQLPGGVTPATAKMKDLNAAVRAASAKRPADAPDIVRIALMAKRVKHRQEPCAMVREIVRAAIAGAPEKSREIVEMAQSIEPECSDSLDRDLSRAGNGAPGVGTTSGAAVPGSATGTTGDDTAANGATGANGGDAGFNSGFGAGFPGSPGFGGSSPSGGFALPTPVPTPVTSSVNS